MFFFYFSFQFSSISIFITLTWLLWIYRTYYSYYKLEIPANLRDHFQYLFDGFKNLRKNKPGLFCGLFSINFVIIAILGRLITGYSAIFAALFVLLVLFTKYDVRIVRENGEFDPFPFWFIIYQMKFFNEILWSTWKKFGKSLHSKNLTKLNETL